MAFYVEDMLVKSQRASQHEEYLEEIFGVIRDKGVMLNQLNTLLELEQGNS